ncbi:MAG TPA: MerR family transcriptional regulator [Firmicutes bacterium]|jgi:DNA-binding transcriptional MerR regulator|nr:MerR family transcriptional regulator [Bacillota bacterium]
MVTISEIAEKLGITTPTLRYYEKLGIIKNIERSTNGIRNYSEKDVNWLQFLLRLKKMKMPLAQIIRYAELRYQGDKTIGERRRILFLQKEHLLSQISELRDSLDYLEQKIQIYNAMEDSQPAHGAELSISKE